MGKSEWGLSNGGLRPLSAICTQSSTIVHFCGLFGPLSKGNFRHKMTTIVGNRGQLRTSTLSPHLLSPHLDFPKNFHKIHPNPLKFLGNAYSFLQTMSPPTRLYHKRGLPMLSSLKIIFAIFMLVILQHCPSFPRILGSRDPFRIMQENYQGMTFLSGKLVYF